MLVSASPEMLSMADKTRTANRVLRLLKKNDLKLALNSCTWIDASVCRNLMGGGTCRCKKGLPTHKCVPGLVIAYVPSLVIAQNTFAAYHRFAGQLLIYVTSFIFAPRLPFAYFGWPVVKNIMR